MLYLPYAALLAAVTSAASTPEVPRVGALKMDFSVLRGSSLSSAKKGNVPALIKRDGLAELTLTNEQTYYSSTLKVGSQGAENDVVVDTGSSDLWVMSSDVDCSSTSTSFRRSIENFERFSHRRLMSFEMPDSTETDATDKNKRADSTNTCTASGSFNTADSSSFQVNTTAPDFSISYADGTYATGYWGYDYIDFGSANVSDCSFAVVNDTSSDIGVFGIGLAQLETTYSGTTATSPYTYENFPLRLKATGAINKVVYSLYLNSADALSGSVLFGAVDHAKYSGQLQTVPLVNIYSLFFTNPIRFDIVLDSITLESSSQNVTVSSSSIAALLDSGTTLTYLPSAILSSLVSLLDASTSSSGYYTVDCDYDSDDIYAVFNFSGVEIKVPMSDLIILLGFQCYLGVLEQSSSSLTSTTYAILGDNFLRNAYIVYDLEDYEISLAQVNFSSSEDIETVTSSIPLAVQAEGYSSTSLSTSIETGSTSSQLSSSGTKSSEGSSAVHLAKSLFIAVVGAGLVLVF
ncbi:acid protease [Metschnikowia bicuspidata var. bicuspidata NRRL YB-4993]|uniref:candidapepsin n=1 Tax=Metschnikowia bicuspidata var. bicuspidata NRRL YB-4993 TaxID=869754 RepID=A0A1A0H1X2_9ASCO|nr:acid protease [Metschnikowia bicuspidata var. bicuspidata NRRL YB-4993]OBA17950.1 acid protease [Metschnikowia bicuspidata var. bicuspidata NRRL YB-4993]